MTDQPDPSTDQLSDQLKEAIGYLAARDLSGADILGREIKRGNKPWFVDELDQALRSHTLTPTRYVQIVSFDDDIEDDPWGWAMLDEDMREVWKQTAGERPYPWDDPQVRPDELDGRPDQDFGISAPLAYSIFNHVHNGDPKSLAFYLADGMIPHVPLLLERNIHAGVFTPSVWHRLAYGHGTDPAQVTEEVVNRDLRALWAVVYPDRPYLDET